MLRAGKASWPWLGLASALGLRLLWMFFARPSPVSDAQFYLVMARDLLAHGQYGWPQPAGTLLPGYPTFLAACLWVSDSLWFLSLVHVLLSVLVVFLVWLLARELFQSGAVALAAAWFCALNPTFVFYAPTLMTENLFLVLFLGVLWVLLRGRVSLPAAALLGLGLGAAILVRGSGLFYLPILALLAYHRPGQGFSVNWQGLLRAALLVVLAISLVGVWWARQQAVFGPGSGLAFTSAMNIYEAHNPHAYGKPHYLIEPRLRDRPWPEMYRLAMKLAKEHVRAHPESIFTSAALGTYHMYKPSISALRAGLARPERPLGLEGGLAEQPPLILAAVAYLLAGYLVLAAGAVVYFVRLAKWPRQASALFVGFFLVHWVGYAWISMGLARYRFVPEVWMCIMAGAVLVWWQGRRSAKPKEA